MPCGHPKERHAARPRLTFGGDYERRECRGIIIVTPQLACFPDFQMSCESQSPKHSKYIRYTLYTCVLSCFFLRYLDFFDSSMSNKTQKGFIMAASVRSTGDVCAPAWADAFYESLRVLI